MRLLGKLFVITALFSSPTLHAGSDLDEIRNLAQGQFNNLAEYLAAATVYKSISPAEPLGVTGFDVSVGFSATRINEALFDEASGSDWPVAFLPVPRIQAHKGLPFNIDVGAFVSMLPDTGISLIGAEVKYAFIEGGITMPALAARLSYSKLNGIDELDMENKALDVSISKGFVMLTPYAGVGLVKSDATPVGIDALKAEEIDDTRVFAGLNINAGINIGLEVDTMAGITSFSGKVGIRF